MKRYDVVAIGHLDRGRIVRGDEQQDAVGGAVYFGGVVLARLGLKVAIVTRLARADSWMLEELEEAGADVYPVWTERSTSIENYYPNPDSDRRISRLLDFAGAFEVGDVPPLEARLFYLGPVAPGEMDGAFIAWVAERGPVALDAQGCLRVEREGGELATDGWPEAKEVLPRIHYLKVDDREAAALVGVGELSEAARKLCSLGPEEVVLTHGGGVIVCASGEIHQGAFRPRSLAGRTGRGDSCFSAYLGRRLLGDPPAKATRFAAALTTLKLERPGPFKGSLEEVERLVNSDRAGGSR